MKSKDMEIVTARILFLHSIANQHMYRYFPKNENIPYKEELRSVLLVY